MSNALPVDASRQLPIYGCEAEIVAALAKHQVIVVEGATGTGKTTQIPRILRRALGVRRIGVTQPRRIAAVSVAWRIAAEERVEIGAEVGYAIRFDDQTCPSTVIKVMTDGILLMEARGDPDLRAYDVLMIDEAHERSLNIDVILGLVHEVLTRRDDLRVIISSATINPAQFQRFFAPVAGDVPLISVPARTYPIDVQYRPPKGNGFDALVEATVDEIVRLHRLREPGHMLVFLTGAGDIRRVEAQLHERWGGPDLEVLPLYGRLTREEQERVFADFGKRRKIVLATNIAETSITIPDVRYVIDCGLAKVPRFSPRSGMTALREELISRASAEQRAGRAGRTGPGIALRLYTEDSMAERPALTEEEILRLDLTEVVLRLIDLGVRDVERFPFPSPPPANKVNSAIATLTALGAIDTQRSLTAIGKRMVPFPLDPRLARMVVEAATRFARVVDDVLVAGAFISSRSPFVMPDDAIEEARAAHRRFFHPLGDAVAQVGLYRAWQRAPDRERFCTQNYLDHEALLFAEHAHAQLADIAKEQGIDVQGGGPKDEIVRSIATGFVDQLIRKRGNAYETRGGLRVALHPSSVLMDEQPAYGVAIELVEHARAYAINVSTLKREWLRELGVGGPAPHGRATEKAGVVRPPPTLPPTRLRLGDLDLTVTTTRGKPHVDLTLEQLARLGDVVPPAEAKDIRARVQWDGAHAFAGVPLTKLAGLLRAGAFPSPGAPPRKDFAFGALLETDRDRHRIEHALAEVLEPAVQRRSAGFVAFVANGAGGYWLDLVPHYRDALVASRLSAETLASELLASDPLHTEVDALLTRLDALEETLA